MKIKDIQKKNDVELKKLLRETQKAATDFRFEVSGSKTRNTKEGKNTRRDVARILTEIRLRAIHKGTVQE